MLTKSTTLILVLFLSLLSFSQQPNGRKIIDSLLVVSKKNNEPKKLTDIYNQLSRELRDFGKNDSSLVFANRALKLAEKVAYPKGQIEANLHLGNSYRELNDLSKAKKHIEILISLCNEDKFLDRKGDGYDNLGHIYFALNDTIKALENHLKSLQIRRKLNDYHGIGNSSDNIGHIYSSQSNFPKALEYFSASLKVFKNTGDEVRLALSYANTGYQYYYIGNLAEALSHFNEALKYYNKTKNEEGIDWMKKMISFVYSELGDYNKLMTYYYELLIKKNNSDTEKANIYLNLGIVYMGTRESEKAISFFNSSLSLYQKENNQEGIMLVNFYFGELNYRQKKHKEALKFYLLSHDYATKINSVYWKSVIKVRVAKSYFGLKNYEEATKWTNEGIAVSEKILSKRDLSEYYLMLSKLDSIKGNYFSSLENYKIHVYYDQIRQTNEANKLTYQLEFNKKEEEILKQQQAKEKKTSEELRTRRSERNTAILAFTITSLFLIIVLYLLRLRNRKIKIERQNIELKQKEIELIKETEQFKSRFLANISHEFRTPLTLIKGNTDILKKQVDAKYVQKLEEINSNGEHLLVLINQLLDLSKMESGEFALNFSSGNLLNEVTAHISAFHSYAEQEEITLSINTSIRTKNHLKDNQFTYSSEAIQTIINNLLSNGLKFTPAGGTIDTEIDFENDIFTLKVSDSGPGIPEKYISKVFDRFYQVEETYKNTQKGSGIGLALVKDFAILHGGDVTVANNPKGGCTFTVWINCQPSTTKNESVAQIETQTAFNSVTSEIVFDETNDKPILLIVEDQNELRQFIVNNIGEDYHCIEAPNGKIGFELAEKHIPDLILSDVMMPEMNGMELCKKVKENTSTSHIPVLLLTAKADQTDKLSGLELGADDYILKPFSIDEVKLKIRNSIRLQQSFKSRMKNNSEISFEKDENQLSEREQNFVSDLNKIIEENISNEQFSVVSLAEAVHLSQSQLTRKLKAIIGYTPSDLIRIQRLENALQILRAGGNVSDAAYQSGFNDPSYFSKVFKSHYNVVPSDYKKI